MRILIIWIASFLVVWVGVELMEIAVRMVNSKTIGFIGKDYDSFNVFILEKVRVSKNCRGSVVDID